MKIQPITKNLHSNISVDNKKNIVINKNSGADCVIFSSKKYCHDDLKNPTNHCAYCGCKVYTEEEIKDIAKEILNSKSSRLQGKVKSVLEKLGYAKNSEEITFAKKLENSNEIEFYKKLLEISSKNPYLKGELIFKQIYKKNYDAAMELLIKNMHPLLRTIDHISPQNRNEKNNHCEINLVEACYCCNHDLKKGMSFNEFYAMFPSIVNNMPQDKFQYAMSNILESGQCEIKKQMSADSIIKSLQRLLVQRKELLNTLSSVDFRIKEIKSQISDKIQSLYKDIAEKKSEISGLESELQQLMQNPRYSLFVKREELKISVDNLNNSLKNLYVKKHNIYTSMENSQKHKNNSCRIEELQRYFDRISKDIALKEMEKFETENKIDEINNEIANMKMTQAEKRDIEKILKIPQKITGLNSEINILEQTIENLNKQK